jgi:hypothetical protein
MGTRRLQARRRSLTEVTDTRLGRFTSGAKRWFLAFPGGAAPVSFDRRHPETEGRADVAGAEGWPPCCPGGRLYRRLEVFSAVDVIGNLLALGGQLMLGLGLLVPAQSRLEVVAGPLTPNARNRARGT